MSPELFNWTYNGLNLVATQYGTVATNYSTSTHALLTTTATTTYTYNADGDLTDLLDADSRLTTYAYNADNQLLTETWYPTSSSGGSASNTESFTYDLNDNMSSATTGSGTSEIQYNYEHDASGNMLAQNMTFGNLASPAPNNVILTSAYDYNGNRTKLSANIGGTMNSDGSATGGQFDFVDTYSYDALGRMTSVQQKSQGTTSGYNGVAPKFVQFGYNSDSLISTIDDYQNLDNTANHVSNAAYSYDADLNLTDLVYSNGSSTYYAAYHWTYDLDDRVQYAYSMNEMTTPNYSGGAYSYWGKASYTYDDNSELTATSYSNYAHPPTTNTTETYDANGNRTSASRTGGGSGGSGGSSASGAENRLMYDGLYYYAYDAQGNRIAQYQTANDSLDSTATNITIYAWNNADELVSAKTYSTYANYSGGSTPSSETDYLYDAFGTMVSRTQKNSSGTITSEEDYVYDGENLALVLNAQSGTTGVGQVTERELYGPAVDQILASEAVATVSGSNNQTAGTVNWMFADGAGSVRDVAQYISGATSLVDHVIFDSFGTLSYQSSSGHQPRFLYDGRPLDSVTGFYYDRARWFNPVDGNWVSQDPLGFTAGQTNLSEYVGNDPVNNVDPSGLASWAINNSQEAQAENWARESTPNSTEATFLSRDFTRNWNPSNPWDGHSPYQGQSIVNDDLQSLLGSIKAIASQMPISILRIGGHAHEGDGITLGKLGLDDLKNKKLPPDQWLQYYVNEGNAEEFAKKIMLAVGTTQHGSGGGTPKLLILESCCLGNYTRRDIYYKRVLSTAQKIANKTGLPVITPGGYSNIGFENHNTTVNGQYNDGKTLFQSWQGRNDYDEATKSTYASKDGQWFLTLPDGQAGFSPLPELPPAPSDADSDPNMNFLAPPPPKPGK